MFNEGSTQVRIAKRVLHALRLAAGELTTATRAPMASDSETIAALLRHWDHTKLADYGMHSRPVLGNGPDDDELEETP